MDIGNIQEFENNLQMIVNDFMQGVVPKNSILEQRVDIYSSVGEALLFYVIKNNIHNLTQYLIEQGVAVNVRNQYSETPLLYALRWSSLEICNLLLTHGADMMHRTSHGNYSLFYALLSNNFLKIQLVLAHANQLLELYPDVERLVNMIISEDNIDKPQIVSLIKENLVALKLDSTPRMIDGRIYRDIDNTFYKIIDGYREKDGWINQQGYSFGDTPLERNEYHDSIKDRFIIWDKAMYTDWLRDVSPTFKAIKWSDGSDVTVVDLALFYKHFLQIEDRAR